MTSHTEQVFAMAALDHAAAEGKVVLVSAVYGYRGDTSESVDLTFDPPARVRVLPANGSDLRHVVSGWLDPYWDVEPAEGETRLAGFRSLWVFGPSYSLATGERSPDPAPALE